MKRLFRSRENRMLLGVLGGIGEYFSVDPTIVRVIYLIIMFATAFLPLTLLYFLLYLIIPEKDIY
ncbi:PspC domain-containing protein [Tuberibacillus calidus]|uniref:PspC domain-containing protein n=1 Tax=Tuberibacillus calidus TaxID=340097 RepID=UPI000486AC0C|nr:PspC domain-containing protein [Tuberibacillus calidus]